MATTTVPAFDGPLDPKLTMENLRGIVHEWLVEVQGDWDKATSMEDSEYYHGWVSSLSEVLTVMVGEES